MRTVRILLGTALVVSMAACGSDSDASGEALTKEEFILQGDALCQKFLEDSEAIEEPTDIEGLIALLDDAIERGETTLDDFKALEPPADGEAVLASLVTALEDSLPKIREARDAATDRDQAATGAAMDEAVAIGQSSDEPAKAYGFQVCGSEAELRADG